MDGMVGKQGSHSICYFWQFFPNACGTAPLAISLGSAKGNTHRRRPDLKIWQSSMVVQYSPVGRCVSVSGTVYTDSVIRFIDVGSGTVMAGLGYTAVLANTFRVFKSHTITYR
ncbi:hypothetical protein SK128_004867 [Halocaridina rubra]|uniref:Uncharacterized protein n=1 Tax=Halocaridina rubra TaxID=373956 RepID=A0AAN8XLZ4_HALRR